MLNKISSKICAVLLLVVCLIFSLLAAYNIAITYGATTQYVAITKNIDAAATYPMEVLSAPLAITIGSFAFILFGTLSLLVSELYYCVLEFFRQRIRK